MYICMYVYSYLYRVYVNMWAQLDRVVVVVVVEVVILVVAVAAAMAGAWGERSLPWASSSSAVSSAPRWRGPSFHAVPCGIRAVPPNLRRLIRSGRELPRSPSLRGCIYLFFQKTIKFFTPFFFFVKLKMKLLCSHTSIIQLWLTYLQLSTQNLS